MSEIDPRALRTAFGSYLTGVTVVTTRDADGTPRGFTANSFTSVSLDPPLLLVCIAKTAASLPVFAAAEGFAVNILAENQKETSSLFASKSADRFAQADWRPGPGGHPILAGVAAWFDCARHELIEAGDHVILIGRVRGFDHGNAGPLGYARGGYVTLGLEQAAVNAAGGQARVVVGAIVEQDGAILLVPEPGSDGLRLPECGREGTSGSAARLRELLSGLGVPARLGFLFAVFENAETGVQSIFYRGQVAGAAPSLGAFVPQAEIPWDRIRGLAARAMLQRYVKERREDAFGIYLGDDRSGEVRALDPQSTARPRARS